MQLKSAKIIVSTIIVVAYGCASMKATMEYKQAYDQFHLKLLENGTHEYNSFLRLYRAYNVRSENTISNFGLPDYLYPIHECSVYFAYANPERYVLTYPAGQQDVDPMNAPDELKNGLSIMRKRLFIRQEKERTAMEEKQQALTLKKKQEEEQQAFLGMQRRAVQLFCENGADRIIGDVKGEIDITKIDQMVCSRTISKNKDGSLDTKYEWDPKGKFKNLYCGECVVKCDSLQLYLASSGGNIVWNSNGDVSKCIIEKVLDNGNLLVDTRFQGSKGIIAPALKRNVKVGDVLAPGFYWVRRLAKGARAYPYVEECEPKLQKVIEEMVLNDDEENFFRCHQLIKQAVSVLAMNDYVYNRYPCDVAPRDKICSHGETFIGFEDECNLDILQSMATELNAIATSNQFAFAFFKSNGLQRIDNPRLGYTEWRLCRKMDGEAYWRRISYLRAFTELTLRMFQDAKALGPVVVVPSGTEPKENAMSMLPWLDIDGNIVLRLRFFKQPIPRVNIADMDKVVKAFPCKQN